MHASIIATDRAATSRSASLVLHLFDLGHALLVEEMARYGIPAPARFMAGEVEEDDREPAVVEDEPEDAICQACNGSGEGMSDGTRCRACRGQGEFHAGNRYADDEDERAAEADRLYDQHKDERAERGGR